MKFPLFMWLIVGWMLMAITPEYAAERFIETDLLIVGGSDSATPAAAQAARMGVRRIVIVNDIEWFGGQWGPAGLSSIDELVPYRGRNQFFPRTGMLLELVRTIRDYNRKQFGQPYPGSPPTIPFGSQR